MLNKETQKVQRKYDRFSIFYDGLEGGIEKIRFSGWRRNLLKGVKGNVLEVGVGTGKNLEYYKK